MAIQVATKNYLPTTAGRARAQPPVPLRWPAAQWPRGPTALRALGLRSAGPAARRPRHAAAARKLSLQMAWHGGPVVQPSGNLGKGDMAIWLGLWQARDHVEATLELLSMKRRIPMIFAGNSFFAGTWMAI